MVQIKNTITGSTFDASQSDWDAGTYNQKTDAGKNAWEVVEMPKTTITPGVTKTMTADGPGVFEGVQNFNNAPQEPQVFNKGEITQNITDTLKIEGIGDKTANKQFVDAVLRVKEGRNATQEEVTGTVRDIVERYGIGDLAPAFGQKLDEPTITEDKVEPEAPKSILEQKEDIINNYQPNIKAEREAEKEAEGVSAIETAKNEATKIANDYQAKVDQMQSDLNFADVMDAEAQIALKNKLEGQAIPMGEINKQLTSGMETLTQEQRISRTHDVYELNTMINAYNAQQRQVQMWSGQYDQAMDNVRENVADWVTMQELKLDLLTEKGLLEKEERAKAEAEIEFERNLGLEGYVPVENLETRDKIMKDMNITASNYNQFFWKDNSTGKIYLKPSTDETLSIAEAKSLGVPFGTTKSQAMNMGITPTTSSGGSTTTTGFKLSSDDRGRLVAVNFTNEDINGIQEDLNEFGIDAVVEGMDEKQAKAVRDIASGLTATQASAQDDPDNITEAKRKVIGGVNALISDGATDSELKEFIKLKGYTIEDFKDIIGDYTQGDEPSKWEKFKSFVSNLF